jgi:hypothetical protein
MKTASDAFIDAALNKKTLSSGRRPTKHHPTEDGNNSGDVSDN